MRRFQLADGVVRRVEFNDLVLEEALRRTTPAYGSYRIEVRSGSMGRDELLAAMTKGELVNVATMATQPAWELRLLPIYIPLDMGLSSYRVSFVRDAGQKQLAAVRTLDDLRKLRAGAGKGWSSKRVMEIDGFNVVSGDNFAQLIESLMSGGIDYFPRGLNEVFVEFDERREANPGLRIDESVLLEFHLPGYVFVSPEFPRLHRRLSEGLEAMVQDGSLRRMVLKFHAKTLQRAELCARKVFRIINPNLFNPEPLQRKQLWLDIHDPVSGLCKRARRPA